MVIAFILIVFLAVLVAAFAYQFREFKKVQNLKDRWH